MEGKVETCFIGNYDVDCGTARCIYDCLVAVLREMDIELSRVIGLGSDGASVMMGRHGGVGALLKQANPFSIQVHCVAHRAALAALDAEKAVNNIKAYKNTISSVYSFYKHLATTVEQTGSANLQLHSMMRTWSASSNLAQSAGYPYTGRWRP